MEVFHRQVLRLACYLTGDKEVEQFTLHKAMLQFLGYNWWDKPGWTTARVFKNVLHPAFYVILTVFVSILTGHRCFIIEKESSIGFLVFMNNIIVIFTFSYAMLKTLYMKFLYGKKAKELMEMLIAIGDMKNGRSAWESSLQACTYFLCLLLNICLAWTLYFLAKYGIFCYQTSYPWDQTTVAGWLAAFQMSFLTAFYCSQIHTFLDSFLVVSCGIMIAHLIVLVDMLKTIGLPGNPDRKILIAAVQLHVKIISYLFRANNGLLQLVEVKTLSLLWNLIYWI